MPRARRRSRPHLAAPLIALALTACRGEPKPQPTPVPIVVPEAVLDPILFDDRGRLRPSELRVGALVIPVGFHKVVEGERVRTFEGHVPIAAVHTYLRSNLVASGIERNGDWLRFAYARPASSAGIANERYDVTVSVAGYENVRIEVVSRAPVPSTMSEEERRRRMREAIRRDSL